MRHLHLTAIMLGGLFSLCSCGLRSDAPPPRFIQPQLPPEATIAAPVADTTIRLGTVDSDELLRLDLIHYAGSAEVLRDPLWRWTTPPAQALRQRLQLSAIEHAVALRDRADLPLVTATVLRCGVVDVAGTSGNTPEFTVQILLHCRLADGTEQTRIVAAQAPFTGGLPGTLPQVAGTVMTTVSGDAWALVRAWCKPGGG